MKKPKKKNATFSDKNILQIFRQSQKPLSKKEIYTLLKIKKQQRNLLRQRLKSLVSEGKLLRIGKAYGLVKKLPMTSGKLEIQRSGVGFVLPEDKRRKDIFISPSNLGDAWHGDKVLVATLPNRRGKNPEGRIVRILEKAQTTIPVKVQKKLRKNLCLAQPTDTRHNFSVMLECKGQKDFPQIGDIVLADPIDQLEHSLWSAEMVETLGPESDIKVQEKIVKTNHGIPTAFPENVLKETDFLPKTPNPEEFTERRDLTTLPFVTIDGATAKDFDDAILVEKSGNAFKLYVAIADVSHYVSMRSALDKEALSRSNSYYFPQSVEPMFPEKLSNGLCSLVPGDFRMVMVAEMDYRNDGTFQNASFYHGVIKSFARLTYNQVKKAILDKDLTERKKIANLVPMLEKAEELARAIHSQRNKRGSLDFDIPEPEILIGLRDKPENIKPRERHFAHQIIEEFMIAANEAVARFLRDKQLDLLYRIHPGPDKEKLEGLLKLLSKTSLSEVLPKDLKSKSVQELLSCAQNTEMEFLVNRLVLRSMKQAVYSPKNEGHFGLASECYCHFTSPIRRYADLVVHRVLKHALRIEKGVRYKENELKQIGEIISSQERVAADAEREIVKRLTILILREKTGQKFKGIISSLSDFGFWVELTDVMAEGLVRLSTLTDDYYTYLSDQLMLRGQRTGRTFRLGQTVEVEIVEANLSRLEVDLRLL